MATINSIVISPPLINTSCAWSSDFAQLEELYDSSFTGAVTTRTATASGFRENSTHTVTFAIQTTSTINSYGYSPHPLSSYLTWVEMLLTSPARAAVDKPFIISITASDPETLRSMLQSIQELRAKLDDGARPKGSRIAVELNTSCPNIPNASPSGYNFSSLIPLLQVLADGYTDDHTLTIGLKLPPFVFREQFLSVLAVLEQFSLKGIESEEAKHPFAFFTCTNTLGNALMFTDQTDIGQEATNFALPTVLGGIAGDSLHALALGNVYTFNELLHHSMEARASGLSGITIIGVGGVTSKEAVLRMRNAGASVVGCATFFGKEGVRAFQILGSEETRSNASKLKADIL